MDRSRLVVKRLTDCTNDDYVPGSMEDRVKLVWPLTVQAMALNKKFDTEAPLQRNVTRVIRGKR